MDLRYATPTDSSFAPPARPLRPPTPSPAASAPAGRPRTDVDEVDAYLRQQRADADAMTQLAIREPGDDDWEKALRQPLNPTKRSVAIGTCGTTYLGKRAERHWRAGRRGMAAGFAAGSAAAAVGFFTLCGVPALAGVLHHQVSMRQTRRMPSRTSAGLQNDMVVRHLRDWQQRIEDAKPHLQRARELGLIAPADYDRHVEALESDLDVVTDDLRSHVEERVRLSSQVRRALADLRTTLGEL